MRRIAIEDFRYLAHSARQHESAERVEQRGNPVAGNVSIEAHIGRDEWPQQPGPDGSLMIRRVALGHRTFIAPPISRIERSKRTEAEWRQEAAFHGSQYPPRPYFRDCAISER